MTINFDMDGTFVDLYGVNNWLEYLINEDVKPYAEAKPLINLAVFARMLNRVQKEGHTIAIISWLSKNGTEAYNEAVAEAKKMWLRKHLPSVKWDKITIVAYGTPKENYCENVEAILFDDEEHNRKNWNGIAYDVDNILEVLKAL